MNFRANENTFTTVTNFFSVSLVSCFSYVVSYKAPSLLSNGYRGSFPGGKARPGRDVEHSPHLIPRSRMSRSYTSSSPWSLHGDGRTALVCFMMTNEFLVWWVGLGIICDALKICNCPRPQPNRGVQNCVSCLNELFNISVSSLPNLCLTVQRCHTFYLEPPSLFWSVSSFSALL
jgi:hypothetical protein